MTQHRSERSRALDDIGLQATTWFQEVRAGDISSEDAVEKIAPLIFPHIVAFLSSAYRLQPADQDEVFQNVVLKILAAEKADKPSRYDPNRGPFIPWIFGLTKNAALDVIRMRDRSVRIIGGNHVSLASPSSPDAVSLIHFNELLATLSHHHRELLTLKYADGATDEELAQLFEKPVSTIKASVRQAMKVLRKLFDKDDSGNPPDAHTNGSAARPLTNVAGLRRIKSRRLNKGTGVLMSLEDKLEELFRLQRAEEIARIAPDRLPRIMAKLKSVPIYRLSPESETQERKHKAANKKAFFITLIITALAVIARAVVNLWSPQLVAQAATASIIWTLSVSSVSDSTIQKDRRAVAATSLKSAKPPDRGSAESLMKPLEPTGHSLTDFAFNLSVDENVSHLGILIDYLSIQPAHLSISESVQAETIWIAEVPAKEQSLDSPSGSMRAMERLALEFVAQELKIMDGADIESQADLAAVRLQRPLFVVLDHNNSFMDHEANGGSILVTVDGTTEHAHESPEPSTVGLGAFAILFLIVRARVQQLRHSRPK